MNKINIKKIILSFFAFICCFILCFASVKIKAISTPVMESGASIRTSGNAGLKFSATIDSLDGVTERGFFVALGEHSQSDIQTAVESSSNTVGGKKLQKVVVNGEDLLFHVVVYNIPAKSYEQKITALAYAYNGSSYTFAATAQSRNILEVAQAAVSDPNYLTNDFVDKICNTSTFVLNGGNFAKTSSFNIGACNSGNSGDSGITLCTKANRSAGSGLNWYKASLKRVSFDKNIYTIVEQATPGNDLDDNKDYDFVIAGYTVEDIDMLTSAFSKSYVYIPGFAASITIKTNDNYEELLGNKIFLKDGDELPNLIRPYYEFAGWYTESDFSGSVKTKKSGNITQTFYAKWNKKESNELFAELYSLSSIAYGYNALGSEQNGNNKQSLYESMDFTLQNVGINNNDYNDLILATIDYSLYSLTSDEAIEVWKYWKNDHPLAYYVSTSIFLSDNNFNILTDEEYKDHTSRREINENITDSLLEYLEDVKLYSTTYDKCLVLHDLICLNTEYHYDNEGHPSNLVYDHNVVGVLVQGTGVCESYARTYQTLLTLVGINNIVVTGSSMEQSHIWNYVEYNDNWFAVDVTWDDNSGVGLGVREDIVYNYFLVSKIDKVINNDFGWSRNDGVEYFLQDHTAESNEEEGINKLYVIPELSNYSFDEEGVWKIREKYTKGAFTYARVRASEAILCGIECSLLEEGQDIIVEKSIDAYGIELCVTMIGSVISDGSFSVDGGIATYDVEYYLSHGFTEYGKLIIHEGIKTIFGSSISNLSVNEFEVDKDNLFFTSINGVLYTKRLYTLVQYPLRSKMTRLDIPDETVFISDYAFRDGIENLKEINIGKNLEISNYADFGNGWIDDDNLPGIIHMAIGLTNFYDLSCVETIMVEDDNQTYSVSNGCLYKENTLVFVNKNTSNIIVTDGAYISSNIGHKDYEMNGINNIYISSTNTIVMYEIYQLKIDNVYFTGTIEEWINGKYALIFTDYNLYINDELIDNLVIPDNITNLYEGFKNCLSIVSVFIPSSLKMAGAGAFANCTNLASITFEDGFNAVGNKMFYGCTSLISVSLPNSLEELSAYMFAECSSLETVYISNGIKKIGYGAFENCTSLNLSSFDNAYYLGTTTNPYYYLYEAIDKSSTTCIISSYCKIIGENAFSSSNLLSIVIPDGVLQISDNAFSYCVSLQSIVIPNSVISISGNAINGCWELVYNEYDNAYYLGDENNPYMVLVSAKNTEITSCIINENCKMILGMAFSDCRLLSNITIPDDIVFIGNSAFSTCTSLKSIIIPDCVTSIDDFTFSNCTSLTNVVLGEEVVSIGNYAFNGCTSLIDITISDKVETIGDFAFTNCKLLEIIKLGINVRKIGDNSFSCCNNLMTIIIPNSLSIIGRQAFMDVSSLAKIYFEGTIEERLTLENWPSIFTYFYSESEPIESGNYWHYVNDEPTIW